MIILFSLQKAVQEVSLDIFRFSSQLPDNYRFRLSDEIDKVNEDYIQIKVNFLLFFKDLIMSTVQNKNLILKDFTQKSSDWIDNRISTIINESKEKLNPNYPLDFTEIYSGFKKSQNDFTQCFLKLLQELTLITPSDSFTQESLDNWWKNVEEILLFHSNFINTFMKKFQDKIKERDEFCLETFKMLNQNY